ncbi:MAG TPA: type II toxin-antitoxin system prevent-host-death family antitoxin [Thermoanaerobaculia bacterium]|nr:type II toxin-antitoxin system prevent-host-death family antitoxin [Thermoanaerobaculia bacterium]
MQPLTSLAVARETDLTGQFVLDNLASVRTTGVTELKASLSEALARVKAGEEILVTEHGRPIAKIVPLPSAMPEAATDELVRAGILRAPDAPDRALGAEFWRLPRPADAAGLSLRALLDERRSGR